MRPFRILRFWRRPVGMVKCGLRMPAGENEMDNLSNRVGRHFCPPPLITGSNARRTLLLTGILIANCSATSSPLAWRLTLSFAARDFSHVHAKVSSYLHVGQPAGRFLLLNKMTVLLTDWHAQRGFFANPYERWQVRARRNGSHKV